MLELKQKEGLENWGLISYFGKIIYDFCNSKNNHLGIIYYS